MANTSTPATSLAALVTPLTAAQNLAQLLLLLQLGGFPADAWESGSAGPIFANTEATLVADLSETLAAIAAGGYLPLLPSGAVTQGAVGPWLDLLGNQFFQSPRNPATFTVGQVTVTDAAGAGPFTIQPNGLTAEDGSETYLFTSTNAGTLTVPKGGSLTLTVQAATAGASYNLANGAISVLVTSLPGCTVSNNPVGSTGTWITTVGTNSETDPLYAQRLANKWSVLGTGSNTGAYYYWATTPSITGSTEVVQCAIFTPNGTVSVVVSGATGPISTPGLALVNAAIQAKRPLTVQVNVLNAVPSNTPIAGIVNVTSAYDPVATLAAVQVAISNVLGAVKIGGTLYIDQVIAAVMAVPGVYNFSGPLVGGVPSPFTIGGQGAGGSITLPSTTVLTPVYTLTSSS